MTADTYHDAVNRTARAAGAFNRPTRCTKLVLDLFQNCPDKPNVLDFGAGPAALQSTILRQHGFAVTAADCGANVTVTTRDVATLTGGEWDVVMLSNVLNVQPSIGHLRGVLLRAMLFVKRGGRLVVNYPEAPRAAGLTTAEVEAAVREVCHAANFQGPVRAAGTAKAPVWLAYRA